MAYFSLVVSSSTRIAYLIDTHGANASHIIALTEFAMNLIAYGTTFFANGLVLSAGVQRTLLVVAGVQAACWLTAVPMYVFGKRVRSFVSAPAFWRASQSLNSTWIFWALYVDRAPSPDLLGRRLCVWRLISIRNPARLRFRIKILSERRTRTLSTSRGWIPFSPTVFRDSGAARPPPHDSDDSKKTRTYDRTSNDY